MAKGVGLAALGEGAVVGLTCVGWMDLRGMVPARSACAVRCSRLIAPAPEWPASPARYRGGPPASAAATASAAALLPGLALPMRASAARYSGSCAVR